MKRTCIALVAAVQSDTPDSHRCMAKPVSPSGVGGLRGGESSKKTLGEVGEGLLGGAGGGEGDPLQHRPGSRTRVTPTGVRMPYADLGHLQGAQRVR